MKIKALVVDDSRMMRSLVMQSLRIANLGEFEFTEAGDGAEALARFNPKHVDIVFIDWNMPKMTGYEFVRKVRVDRGIENIPIVMITSERSMGKMQDALDKAGADQYITKPFTSSELHQKLEKIIGEISSKTAEGGTQKGGFFTRLLCGG
jgi:two-component system, chemotaxis family, chemotaxis protein CheY